MGVRFVDGCGVSDCPIGFCMFGVDCLTDCLSLSCFLYVFGPFLVFVLLKIILFRMKIVVLERSSLGA